MRRRARSRTKTLGYGVETFYSGTHTHGQFIDVQGTLVAPLIFTNLLGDDLSIPLPILSTTTTVDLSGVTRIKWDVPDDAIAFLADQLSLIIAHYRNGVENDALSSFVPQFAITSDGEARMDDYVSEQYKTRIASGEIINNPSSSSSEVWICSDPTDADIIFTDNDFAPSITAISTFDVATNTYSPSLQIFGTLALEWNADGAGITSPIKESIIAQLGVPVHMDGTNAANDAIGNMADADFDLLVFAAEFGKTARHLAYTAKRIFNIYKAIKKGKFSKLSPKTFHKWKKSSTSGKAGLSADIISDAWLEARYAWRPLMYDAQGIVKALNRSYGYTRRTFRGGASESVTETGDFSVFQGGLEYQVSWSSTSVKSARAGILTHTDLGVGESLGLHNVASTVWEIVPFSFVVDWFVNMGGVLSTIDSNPNVKTLASWTTLRTQRKVIGHIVVIAPGSEDKHMNFSYVSELKDRSDNVAQPTLTLDVNLDASKLVDTAALLWRIIS
jgi:hypothetical protein